MATLFKTKKKTKPKIIEINDFVSDQQVDQSADTGPTTSERTPILSHAKTVINIDNTPSAPPEDHVPEYRPTGLADPQTRANFMAKVHSVLFAQKAGFSVLLGIFTYVPHLRKVVRKNLFDPLFLSSFIGYPLFIVPLILMAIFPKLRRKLSIWCFIILTICLSLLMSYAMTPKTAQAFLYEMICADACDLGVIVGSKMKRDFTKWRYIAFIPTAMIGSSILAPTILRTSVNYTVWPSIAMTAGSTYLACNTVPVIRHNDLHIKPDEYVFAAIQLYLNPEQDIRRKFKQWFCGPTEPRDRSGYAPIA